MTCNYIFGTAVHDPGVYDIFYKVGKRQTSLVYTLRKTWPVRATGVYLVVSLAVQLHQRSCSVLIMDAFTSNVIYVDKRAVRDRYAISGAYLRLGVPTLAAESRELFEVEDQEVRLNISTLLSVFSKGRFRNMPFVAET